MASPGLKPAAEEPQVPSLEGCSGSSMFEALARFKDPSQVSEPEKTLTLVEGTSSCLPRNVLSERERRKRISVSCERLRALLPQFDGRREDMASVLEMTVQFLQLVHTMVPGWEQHSAPTSSGKTWHTWQEDILQLTLASRSPAGRQDLGTAVSGVNLRQDPVHCAVLGVDERNRPPSLLEPSNLVSRPPPWPPHPLQPASPKLREEVPGRLCQVGSLTRGTESPGGMIEEANTGLMPVLDARSVSGSNVEDGTSFLLTASPDWWLGPMEGRGGTAPARNSPVDRAELSFLGNPESGSQETQDNPLEPWVSDLSSWGLALRDDVDSIFSDFFAS